MDSPSCVQASGAVGGNQQRTDVRVVLSTALIVFGALLMLLGVRILLTESQVPQTNFKLLATRSSASVSLWSTYHGNGRLLSKIDIIFSEDLGNPSVCASEELDLCLKWLEDRTGRPQAVLHVKELSRTIPCHENVITVPADKRIVACFDLQGIQLYGGAVTSTQYWPSQKNNKSESAYVTGIDGNEGVVEPYWLTSSGSAIFVPPDVPLFISQNDSHLCLTSMIQPPYLPDDTEKVSLKFYLCSGSDPVATHMHATQSFLPRPRDIPDERMFRHPIWSTWARYKRLINTFIVTNFAQQIVNYGFNNSQLEIDDNWETCYGSAEFFNATFSDPKSLVQSLKQKGFRVTLWTHPFINIFCPAHAVAIQNRYLAMTPDMKRTLTMWWDGLGGVLNFTNADAVTWWTGRLKNLSMRYGIDAFKYDAGEAAYLPGAPLVGRLNAPVRLQPNVFTTRYVQTVANVSTTRLAEVRVVHRNQGEPIFVRMSDKSSTWSIENGLKALVTTLLAMNMVGYSFVMPDMVGGNGYSNQPTKELFIRWLQANTFMPTIQFSYVPWDYDTETVEIAKKFTSLHYQYSDTILELAKKKVADSTPINLPLWWLDPTDEVALKIDSEFLLGEDILVAPVLDEGARHRDIYLPAGRWRDELHPDILHSGKRWLLNYTVQLDELAYFTRVS
ncbi:hypothetical protein ANN_10915 [Periplaneta americana]|uniref:Uncharacterized protein n=1 Tax=Periplaneta americana TaxID=6978 RepID=A0ABQ8T5A4_PERAM|nr:hypothetical protein ANN_10915 [Periplaneta americana]